MTSGAGTLAQGATDVMSIVSTVISTITGNPILLAAFVVGLVGVGIALAKRLTH